MELHQLRYFVATAECGSVSRAAERCFVAQPSLSQQLKKLEQELGAMLFDRLGRGVALTDAGRALLPRARRILADIRETETNLKREAEDGPGTLIVGAIPTMAPYLLPPALRALRRAYPACAISVREDLSEALVDALENNEIDCALVSTPLDDTLLDLEVIGEEELLVALPRHHPAATRAELRVSELRGEPTVALADMHCLSRQIDHFCSTRHIATQVVCRTTQLSTITELVSLGLGLSLVPEMAAAADRSDRCRYLRLRPGKPVRQIAVAWRTGRSRPAAAVRFIAALTARLGAGRHASPASP
jgi:LysR family hydrogen peroxide-inducible transcriptional activator